MYIDKQLVLSDSQAVTSAAGSDNYIDLGSARDIGMTSGLLLLITVMTAATASGSATVQFQLQSDDNTSFSSATTVIETDAIPKATLVQGYQFAIPLPPGLKERYARLYYNVGTGPLTAGAFSAQVIEALQNNIAYPDAI